jgi:hypothetical protein
VNADEEMRAAARRLREGAPLIAEPLADWLESAADDCLQIGADRHALATARAINDAAMEARP